MAAKTGRSKPSKNAVAKELARKHFDLEPGMRHIFRVTNGERESNASEPIILLEVNEHTVPAGLMPLQFGPNETIPYATVIAEITPDEYRLVSAGKLKLPRGWRIAEELTRPESADLLE